MLLHNIGFGEWTLLITVFYQCSIVRLQRCRKDYAYLLIYLLSPMHSFIFLSFPYPMDESHIGLQSNITSTEERELSF